MTRKEIAVSFLRNAAAGTLDEVFSRHVAAGFVHHVLEDGDLVAVHSHVRHHANERR